jgi:Sec-independent protein secretion pathway component TatC
LIIPQDQICLCCIVIDFLCFSCLSPIISLIVTSSKIRESISQLNTNYTLINWFSPFSFFKCEFISIVSICFGRFKS